MVSKDISLELYVEGNVVLKKDNDLRINADRMYFDVQTERGIIREAEVRANLPKAIRFHIEGLNSFEVPANAELAAVSV